MYMYPYNCVSEGCITFISTKPKGHRLDGEVLINVIYPKRGGCYNEFMFLPKVKLHILRMRKCYHALPTMRDTERTQRRTKYSRDG